MGIQDDAVATCAAYRVTENGQTWYFTTWLGEELMDAAQTLRRYCTSTEHSTGKFISLYSQAQPITPEEYQRMIFKRRNTGGNEYWVCTSHFENRESCSIQQIPGKEFEKAIRRLYYKLKHQSLPILEQMLETLQTIRDRRLLWSEDIVSLNKKISELSSQNQTLAFLKQNGLVDPDIFISKSNELTRQLRQAKLDKEKLMAAEGDATAHRTRELIALLEDGPDFLDRPDTELCGALVAEIIVESNDTLRFRLHNGLELRESIERTVR